ncbi:glycosyltransferase family protein [Vibrio vulnificus]|uniref:glycosyltransferase n=1 Tax=Vibrio vulnificus TaxID=672 RepID=UPI001CDC0FD7|nr:glycosyltransferase [Vibrio vulnificus]MCA4021082.1 glycosyltransferase [Vibrio vulnificus]
MNVLINASAAREGGARTIVNSYLKSKENDGNIYYLVSPVAPEKPMANLIWVKFGTNGVFTTLFSIFGSWFLGVFFRVDEIISFSNVNLMIGKVKLVTYFHNHLIITSRDVRYKLLRFALKWLSRKDALYVFQTPFVKKEFEKKLFSPKFSLVAWPGVVTNKINFEYRENPHYSCSFLIPIMNLYNRNKNIDFLITLLTKYNFEDVKFIVTSDQYEHPINKFPNVELVGKLDKLEFEKEIVVNDGIMVFSEVETVCLPIFEALFYSKPVLLLGTNYFTHIEEMFGEVNGVIKFTTIDEAKKAVEIIKSDSYERGCNIINNESIFKGNWSF